MKEKLGGNLKAKDEKKGLNMAVEHFSRLYDLDEDMAGEKVDPSNGQPINNSIDDHGPVELKNFKPNKKSKDVMPRLREKNDAAAQWLKQKGIS